MNKSILVGRIGAEPEIREFEDGGAVLNLGLATNRRWTNRETQERVEETTWHNLVFRNGLAKVVAEHLHKGDQIYVEGHFRNREWVDAEKNTRYTPEVVVTELEMLGGRNDAAAPAPQKDADHAAPGLDGDEPDFDKKPAAKKPAAKKAAA